MPRALRHALLSCVAILAWLVLYGVAASPAWAHFTGVPNDGWLDGFAHPFTGVDHLVTIVAIGLWAMQIGGRAPLLVPAAFALAMAGGAALALAGLALPGSEDAIAVSLAVMGVLLAVAARPKLAVGIALVAVFGLAHGYAHGTAMPDNAWPVLYAMGFLTATLLLQVIGLMLGLLTSSRLGQKLLPIGAAALAGLGVTLMLAW